jgi:Flp pilus assembly protein TadG
MRVGRFSLARLRDGEEGAVLAIVVITLLVLTGMLVLTFDLGRGVALKRNMVNAADSGALAAARECGLAHGRPSAEQAAGELVADNNDAATVTDVQIDPNDAVCSGGANPAPDGRNTVTVTVNVPQEYFFAQIFGFDGGTVVASATAEWSTGITAPAPLKLDDLKVESCEDGTLNGEGLYDCYFTFEKGGQPLNSDWGWLNLPEGWPIQGQDTNPPTCTSQKGGSKDLSGYIGSMGGMGTPAPGQETLGLALWDPEEPWGDPPTWVCSSTGHKAVNVEDINRWVASAEQWMNDHPLEPEPVALFPIVACDPLKTPGDPDCREWKYTPGVAYPVVRLQGFYIKEAWDGQEARRQPNCHFTRPSSDVFCIHLQTSEELASTSGGDVTVRLVD